MKKIELFKFYRKNLYILINKKLLCDPFSKVFAGQKQLFKYGTSSKEKRGENHFSCGKEVELFAWAEERQTVILPSIIMQERSFFSFFSVWGKGGCLGNGCERSFVRSDLTHLRHGIQGGRGEDERITQRHERYGSLLDVCVGKLRFFKDFFVSLWFP